MEITVYTTGPNCNLLKLNKILKFSFSVILARFKYSSKSIPVINMTMLQFPSFLKILQAFLKNKELLSLLITSYFIKLIIKNIKTLKRFVNLQKN